MSQHRRLACDFSDKRKLASGWLYVVLHSDNPFSLSPDLAFDSRDHASKSLLTLHPQCPLQSDVGHEIVWQCRDFFDGGSVQTLNDERDEPAHGRRLLGDVGF